MDMKHAGHGGYAGRRRIFRRARAGIPEKYRRLGLACMLCLLAAPDLAFCGGRAPVLSTRRRRDGMRIGRAIRRSMIRRR